MNDIKKFVCIGHVDTGKSCLCGHLLYKCGYVDEHEIDKIRKQAKIDKMEKWVWSRVLDIYEEEMKRGKTHEYNEINFEKDGKKYQLIDTPGHKSFIRQMIEGISGNVNIAVLLLSMIDNEFESSFERGMLKEHLILARAVGIEHLIIIGNKMDVIMWDKEECNKKIKKVMSFIKKKIKWPIKNISIVMMSAFHGIGLTDLDGIGDEGQWYIKNGGKSFLECLDQIPITFKSANLVDEEKDNEKDKDTDRFLAKVMLLGLENEVVTIGYKCIVHCEKQEFDIEIDQIKKVIIARNGDIIECIMKLDKKYIINANAKIIMRKNENTIGYGTIVSL